VLDFDGLVGEVDEPGELAGSHAEGVVEYVEEKEQMAYKRWSVRCQHPSFC
jgi:hypothetical protein